MKACCSNLKCVKEFVFEDEAMACKNSCDICGSELLLERKEGYKNIWLSPNTALTRFKNLMFKHGTQQAIANTKFKHEREAWVTAIWALGLSSVTKKEYWIKVETEENTPDTYVYQLDIVNGNNHRGVYNIEVVDWESHVDDVFNIIVAKCKKQYPHFFTLLIYARNPKVVVDLEKVYEKVQELTVPFAQIWLIGESAPNFFTMVKLYGDKSLIQFDLHLIQKIYKGQIPFTTMLKRGTGSAPEPLGKVYLPIP